MTDFLLELLTEEIPARMQAAAIDQLCLRFGDGIAGARLPVDRIDGYVTPRRLVVYATGLGAEGNVVSDERRGPRVDAPEQAIAGFVKSTGIARDAMEERDTPKGRFLYATIVTPGRSAADILADIIPAIVRDFDWPKSMRWGDASTSTASPRWVRPLSGIVALLSDVIVPFDAAGFSATRTTFGHRFLSTGPIEIASAATYADQLRDAHVMLDAGERARVIEAGAHAAATAAGLTIIPDAGLVAENAGLTEWPVPLLGRFDAAFLDVPREVIQLTMRTNQKYFACVDGADDSGGALAPAFVCVANVAADDGGAAIVAGNEKVLAARLSDAKFFWDADLARVRDGGLAGFTPKLADIVFHEKLGTVADKVERVAKLARWLVESGAILPHPPAVMLANASIHGGAEADGASRGAVDAGLRQHDSMGGGDAVAALAALALAAASAPAPAPAPEVMLADASIHGGAEADGASRGTMDAGLRQHDSAGGGDAVTHLATLAETAARLCKADLVSATVGEFPEVQGIAGGRLAAAEGLDPQIAAAIRDHYKPVGPSDEVPTAPVTVAVALADKLDTILSFLSVDLAPTGSKDPYAIRRALLASIALIFKNDLRFSLNDFVEQWLIRTFDLMRGGFDESSAQNMQVTGYNLQIKMLIESISRDQYPDIWKDVEQSVKALIVHGKDPRLSDWNDLLQRGSNDNFWELRRTVTTITADRLKIQQREAGVRPDIIDAVFALGGEDDLVRLLARVKALQAVLQTPDGISLLAGYKRGANILRIEEAKEPGVSDGEVDPDRLTEPAEIDLNAALDAAVPDVAAAVADERFESAMSALARLRPAVDAFFTHVTVNAADAAVRRNRLALLARLRTAVHSVADFSKLDG